MIKNYSEQTEENEYLNVKMLGFGEQDAGRHTFPCSTLYFIISGKGYFDGVPLGAGDGFSVRKNRMAQYAPDTDEPWTYCMIGFDGKAADGLLDMAGLMGDKCTFSLKDNMKIAGLIRSALDFDYGKTDVSLHLNAVLLEIFALMTADKPDTFENPANSLMEERVRAGIEYISSHYAEKNCIENLAAAQKVNKRYLSRLFGLYSDRSPQAHLIRIRIDEAKKLLRTTSLQIGVIASRVGYDDAMQFSKIFKKHTGVSPTEYRKGTMEIVKK